MGDPNSHMQQALEYLEKGQEDEAITELDEVIRLAPDDAEAYYQRGNAYRSLRRFGKARDDYESAVLLRPDHAETYVWLGECFAKTFDHQRAIELYDTAIKLDSVLVAAYVQRGRSFYESSQHEDALVDFEKALELDSSCEEAEDFRKLVITKLLHAGKYTGKVENLLITSHATPVRKDDSQPSTSPPDLRPSRLTTPKPPHDIAQAFPDLARRMAPTVRLHPRRGTEPAITESKLGGQILWPSDEPWPRCQEHNDVFVPVLQLRGEEFPELELPAAADLLQVLWCPQAHADLGYCPFARIVLRESTSISNALQALPEPREFQADYKPAVCVLMPERIVEYPSAFELSEELLEEIDAWIERRMGEDEWFETDQYQYLLSTAPGTKVGGHVHWIQDPHIPLCRCGRPMKHLLTIASNEYDGASYSRWCPTEEQQQNRSDTASDAGLMLGDYRSMYLFVCRHCSPWNLQTVHQCS